MIEQTPGRRRGRASTPRTARGAANLYLVQAPEPTRPGHKEDSSMSTWDEAIAGYALAMRAAGRSVGTMRLHAHYLRQIRGCAPCPAHVTTARLRELLANEGWAPETRRSCRSVAARFFRWAHAEGLIPDDPAARLDPVTVPSALPHPAPERVIADALARCAPRERAMILLGAYAGLRCCEIAQVHSSRWDPHTQRLTVIGKGSKERRVPVVRDDLLAVLNGMDGYLFPGRVDGHLSPRTVSKILSRELPGDWTAHALRHRAATAAYSGTRDVLAVGAMLGHSKPETTKRYILMPDDAVLAAVRAAA